MLPQCPTWRRKAAVTFLYYNPSLLHALVAAPAKEFHKPQVAQNLQLLADFVAHVPVVGKQPLQLPGERVNVLKEKLFPVYCPHDVEHIQRPPACVYYELFKKLTTQAYGAMLRTGMD